MKIKFTEKEVSFILISSLVLGFVFGFDDGREFFDISFWFSNYMLMTLLSLISLTIFILAQKYIASRYKCSSSYKIWTMRRFGFWKSAYLHKRKGGFISAIPLGILLPIILAFLSEGKLLFAVTGTILLATSTVHRLGKKFTQVTDFESAKIALAGPMASIFLVLILSLFKTSIPFYPELARINIAVAISNMIPLPGVTGCIVFFGSRFLYIFSLAFIIFAAVLIWFANTLPAIMLALLIALIIVIIAYYFGEIK